MFLPDNLKKIAYAAGSQAEKVTKLDPERGFKVERSVHHI